MHQIIAGGHQWWKQKEVAHSDELQFLWQEKSIQCIETIQYIWHI